MINRRSPIIHLLAIALAAAVTGAWFSAATAQPLGSAAPAQHSCAELSALSRSLCDQCVSSGAPVSDCYWRQQSFVLRRNLGNNNILIGPFPMATPAPWSNAGPAPWNPVREGRIWRTTPSALPTPAAPTAAPFSSFVAPYPNLNGHLPTLAQLINEGPEANRAPYPPVQPYSPGIPGFAWSPVPIASPLPIELNKPVIIVPSSGGKVNAIPASPDIKPDSHLSVWCRAFNNAKGVAEAALLGRDVAGLLGVSEAAVPAAEAEGIAAAVTRATANHSVVILVAAGTGIYLLEKKCAPAHE